MKPHTTANHITVISKTRVEIRYRKTRFHSSCGASVSLLDVISIPSSNHTPKEWLIGVLRLHDGETWVYVIRTDYVPYVNTTGLSCLNKLMIDYLVKG